MKTAFFESFESLNTDTKKNFKLQLEAARLGESEKLKSLLSNHDSPFFKKEKETWNHEQQEILKILWQVGASTHGKSSFDGREKTLKVIDEKLGRSSVMPIKEFLKGPGSGFFLKKAWEEKWIFMIPINWFENKHNSFMYKKIMINWTKYMKENPEFIDQELFLKNKKNGFINNAADYLERAIIYGHCGVAKRLWDFGVRPLPLFHSSNNYSKIWGPSLEHGHEKMILQLLEWKLCTPNDLLNYINRNKTRLTKKSIDIVENLHIKIDQKNLNQNLETASKSKEKGLRL